MLCDIMVLYFQLDVCNPDSVVTSLFLLFWLAIEYILGLLGSISCMGLFVAVSLSLTECALFARTAVWSLVDKKKIPSQSLKPFDLHKGA
jgi:hypothetical protein